jgi:hypothetical protein
MVNDTLFSALPVELRVEILRHYCGHLCPIYNTDDGPLLLIRVSRAWRTLTLETPQLWSSFSLEIQKPLPPSAGRRGLELVCLLKRWLFQSRNAPLSFVIRYPAADATCRALVEAITPVSERWRDVTLSTPNASLLGFVAETPGSFPALKALSVECVGLPPLALRSYPINWGQLSRLDLFLISVPHLDDCLHILQHGENLVSCSMNVYCTLEARDIAPLALPKLRELSLKLHGPSREQMATNAAEAQFHAFFDVLELPGLHSLELTWTLGNGPHRWSRRDKLAAALRRVGAHLDCLHLGYLPFDAPIVEEALEAVPGVRQLSLSAPQGDAARDYIDNDLFRALTGTRLVPKLESLRLNCHGESFSNPVFLRFIESRWAYPPSGKEAAGGHLAHIEIVSPKRVAEYVPDKFRDLKENKLDVRASLKAKADLLVVLRAFLNTDAYKTLCFLNGDFSEETRSLLVF